MVHQIPIPANFDIEVCKVSYQRHCVGLLNRRGKILSNNLRKVPQTTNTPLSNNRKTMERQPTNLARQLTMNINGERAQQLPVVELKPFTTQVWRREKSLPDFYDKKKLEEASNNSPNSNFPDNSTNSSNKVVQDFNEMRRSVESRQNTLDSSFGKHRNHPKAEFLHESNREWHKQDLIPSFITRFERTKTSIDSISRENTSIVQQKVNFENPSMFENALRKQPNPAIKLKGGRMSQRIHRRHLLYLNPLESYRQPYSLTGPRLKNGNTPHLQTTRHSFPMSNKTKEIVLGDTRAQHPLKPIRREGAESPHKFNNKLGAARNSLEVLSKVGIQTKLEKSLEREMEWNLERYRKDRLLFSHDLKGVQLQCFNFDSNLTRGEMLLRNAQDANKQPKGKHRSANGQKIKYLNREVSSFDIYNYSEYAMDDIGMFNRNASTVNPILHPIDNPLVEESETNAATNSEVSKSMMGDRERSLSLTNAGLNFKHKQLGVDTGLINNSKDQGNQDATNVNALQSNVSISELKESKGGRGIADANNNNTVQKTTEETLDSARLETNVAYLENLQFKSTPDYHPTPKPQNHNKNNNSRPEAGIIHKADTAGSNKSSNQHITQPALSTNRSDYTSYHEGPMTTRSMSESIQGSTNIKTYNPPFAALEESQNPNTIPTEHTSLLPEESLQAGKLSQSMPSTKSETTLASTSMSTPRNQSHYTPNSSASLQENLRGQDFAGDEQATAHNDDNAKQRMSELNNSSPQTSSGFESQPVTDQEDEDIYAESNGLQSKETSGRQTEFGVGEIEKGEHEKNQHTISNDQNLTNQEICVKNHTDLADYIESTTENYTNSFNTDADIKATTGNETNASRETVLEKKANFDIKDPNSATPRAMMDGRRSTEEDEGISMSPPDGSHPNPTSPLEVKPTDLIRKDFNEPTVNGDSGVSTTFLTSEDAAKPEHLEAVLSS